MTDTTPAASPEAIERHIRNVLEAALFAAGKPLSLAQLQGLFLDHEQPGLALISRLLQQLRTEWTGRGICLEQVASGFRIATEPALSSWVSRLWEERPAKYTRALLETLALIAYRQPVTRGDIERVRGVSVSSGTVKTLQEREWIRVVGRRDVPGRPALYGTTKVFLDYFGLDSLQALPPLSELKDWDRLSAELDLALPNEDRPEAAAAADQAVMPQANVDEAADGDRDGR